MIMKQTKLITLSFTLLLLSYAKAQKNTIDTILWDNGNYSLVSELGKVWIIEKNDRKHKNVKIHKIDTALGRIEYYFEGTFHDVVINNIERITPGKFYTNAIFFKKNKVPVIKLMIDDGFTYDHGSFKSRQKPKPIVIEEVVVEEPVITNPVTSTTSFSLEKTAEDAPVVFDVIIFNDGRKLSVKILSIKGGEIHYKRADILSGPVYIISLSIPGTLKVAKVIPNNGHKIIDYRN